jgi:hypothetical protein
VRPRPPAGRRPGPALALALLAGCGYAAAAGLRLPGGADRAQVVTFENRSSDPSVGVEVAAALRRELARRGAEGGPGTPAVIEGEVRTAERAPSFRGGATLRVALEVRARLRVGGEVRAERTVRLEAEHLAGVDALEGEGRRFLALRSLAERAARELLDAFDEG